jgi:hypothetical protein
MTLQGKVLVGTFTALLLGLVLAIGLFAARASPEWLASEFTVGDSAVTTVGDTAVNPAHETGTFATTRMVAGTEVFGDTFVATLDDTQAMLVSPMRSVDDNPAASLIVIAVATAILGGLFLTLTDKRYPLKLLTDVVGSFWHRGMRFLLSVITGGARTSRRLVAPLAAVILALAWTSSSAFAGTGGYMSQDSAGFPMWTLVALGLGSVALVAGGLVTRRAGK